MINPMVYGWRDGSMATELLGECVIRKTGVEVNGVVLRWETLQYAMSALAAATSPGGRVDGTDTNFGRHAQEAFRAMAGMMLALRHDNK
jgi:hypothetical protein